MSRNYGISLSAGERIARQLRAERRREVFYILSPLLAAFAFLALLCLVARSGF